MKLEDGRPEQWDDIRRPADEVAVQEPPPPSSRGRWIVVAVLLAAAGVAAYIVFGRPEPATAPPTAPATEAERSLGGDALPVNLPPLDQSDAIVAELVRALSSHPRVAAWLTTEGLIRNFTEVVWTIADQKTPARLLRPLRPPTPFRVLERGGSISIDPRSYERYNSIAEAVSSIDARGAASLYATLKPRIEEAHRDLGERTSFDRTLEEALVLLLKTPVQDGGGRVAPRGIGYAFADPAVEALSPAQKQLLRMGPANARAVQAKLREIALALGIPPQRLP